MRYYTNLFSQMLHVIKRTDFEKAVREHKTKAHSKGFSSLIFSIRYAHFTNSRAKKTMLNNCNKEL